MKNSELEKLEYEWNAVNEDHKASRQQCWDKRASDWDAGLRSDEQKRSHYDQRISATIEWLQGFGLLKGDCDVADIGCGPGRFVAEFAKRSRRVLGVDISEKMAQYGESFSKEMGLSNTQFYTGDFPELDIESLGWSRRFDLAFSSITPAIKGKSGIDNLIAMSREWCYNSCFVYFSNDFHDQILSELFQLPPNRERTSHSNWFKQLFDLLWLRGYRPYVHYYKEHRDESITAERSSAENLARCLLGDDPAEEDIDKILHELERSANQDGKIYYTSDCWYGWLLWNVNDRTVR
jgi:SAM-dependent methyltransferase